MTQSNTNKQWKSKHSKMEVTYWYDREFQREKRKEQR